MPRSERYIYILYNILVNIMNSKNILILSLCVLVVLVVAGCTYKTISDSTTETIPDSDEKQQDNGCNNHYFTKFGIGSSDVTVENTECEWTPDDRYGVVDSIFKAQIKDAVNNDYNIFYKKGCCHRHGYAGFTICIMSQNGETDLFQKMKSEICSKLNNQFGDFTTQCENGKFEKNVGNSIILSLKNDYIDAFGSDIKTVSVESNNCLDLN
jgi:hypothetical protein